MTSMDERDALIADLQQQVADQQRQIAEKDKRIAELTEENHSLASRVEVKTCNVTIAPKFLGIIYAYTLY